MFDKIKEKLGGKGTDKGQKIKAEASDSREALYAHWHHLLFSYILMTVIFVGISLVLIYYISSTIDDFSPEGDASDESVLYDVDSLEQANGLQRYKTLIRQQVIELEEVSPR